MILHLKIILDGFIKNLKIKFNLCFLKKKFLCIGHLETSKTCKWGKKMIQNFSHSEKISVVLWYTSVLPFKCLKMLNFFKKNLKYYLDHLIKIDAI